MIWRGRIKVKPTVFLLCLAVSAAHASADRPIPTMGSWTVVKSDTDAAAAPGGHVDTWLLRRATSNDKPVTLVLAILPSNRYRAAIQHADRHGPTASVYMTGLCDGGAVVVNGNFFVDTDNVKSSLGLLRVKGKTITRASSRKTGGFLIVEPGGTIKILTRPMAALAERAADVVESTPVLINDGRDAMRADDHVKFDRVAVGNSRSGDLVFVGAFASQQRTMSLAEFSRLATAAARTRRVEIDDLLAMDGGPSAHLWLPRSKKLHGARGPTYLPSAICAMPR